jgi:hypothetical protein
VNEVCKADFDIWDRLIVRFRAWNPERRCNIETMSFASDQRDYEIMLTCSRATHKAGHPWPAIWLFTLRRRTVRLLAGERLKDIIPHDAAWK